MRETVVDISRLRNEAVGQLKYASYFIDENISDIKADGDKLRIYHDSDKSSDEIAEKVDRLIDRFTNEEFGYKEEILFENRVNIDFKDNIILKLKEAKRT
jgi:hypothetical protein